MKYATNKALLVAIAIHQTSAFQPAISRKALFQKLATTAATSAVVLLPPIVASAAPEPTKSGGKPALRGGKEMSDALHNGTDLNKGQAAVASGLLDKMGLNDITPDKGANSRAPPKSRKS